MVLAVLASGCYLYAVGFGAKQEPWLAWVLALYMIVGSASGLVFLLVGLPSLLIVIGLMRRLKWIAWVAIANDGAVLAGLVYLSVGTPGRKDYLTISGDMLPVCLPFLAEALYLLFALRRV
jgi:hypothetical protein